MGCLVRAPLYAERVVAAPKLERITVSEAVTRYLRTVERSVLGGTLAQTTAKNYARDLAEFVQLAGPDTILDDMDGEHVDDVLLAFRAKPDTRFKPRPGVDAPQRGTGSQARFRQSVSSLFREAALAGWVEMSPMPRSKVSPKVRDKRRDARTSLSESSAHGLLEAPSATTNTRSNHKLVYRDTFILRLLMEAGPRVSEVCRADRSDLTRRDDGTWWLQLLGKGNKQRVVPLSTATKNAYDLYVNAERPPAKQRQWWSKEHQQHVVTAGVEDAENALLLTYRGVRMTPRDIQLMVARSVKLLPPAIRREVTPHGLRHTAATLLLSSGAADIKTVKELLGHGSIAVTGIYLDMIDTELAEAVRAHPITGDHVRSAAAAPT
jgi:site-specific recombinase XerD